MSDDDSRASTSSSSSSSSNQQTEKEANTPKKKESKVSMSKNSKLLSTSAKRIQKELADITLDPPPNCSSIFTYIAAGDARHLCSVTASPGRSLLALHARLDGPSLQTSPALSGTSCRAASAPALGFRGQFMVHCSGAVRVKLGCMLLGQYFMLIFWELSG
ncbi:ubiquitin-conjugating enzyme E2 E1 isoform X3 [Muntiacus reevesi]|uniref:ubiquitin-conjugating enzyme E2 E1 isoform X3 n=1 Tax=Muntiacus reevesi TaxID=9886 RepID=UPI0033078BE4